MLRLRGPESRGVGSRSEQERVTIVEEEGNTPGEGNAAWLAAPRAAGGRAQRESTHSRLMRGPPISSPALVSSSARCWARCQPITAAGVRWIVVDTLRRPAALRTHQPWARCIQEEARVRDEGSCRRGLASPPTGHLGVRSKILSPCRCFFSQPHPLGGMPLRRQRRARSTFAAAYVVSDTPSRLP